MTGHSLGDAVHRRLSRLPESVGRLEVGPIDFLADPRPLIGLTSSRLGTDPRRWRQAGQFLGHVALQARKRDERLLIASGSAIEPWARRAADLHQTAIAVMSVAPDSPGDLHFEPADSSTGSLSRDEILIAVADRVQAAYVRRGGIVRRCLLDRLSRCRDASVRVAVSNDSRCAATELIQSGAVGWYRLATEAANDSTATVTFASGEDSRPGSAEFVSLDLTDLAVSDQASAQELCDDWLRQPDEWLVHCTRSCPGPWPGQTANQFQDSVILGDEDSIRRGPLQSLIRIVRSGRLMGNSKVTRRAFHVVCFSEVPLAELLSRRCFRPHLGRWDYEPYGIAIRKSVANDLGCRPVIYGTPEERADVPADQNYRFQAVGSTFDWRSEREWRYLGTIDLHQLPVGAVRLFVASREEREQLSPHSRWPISVAPPLPVE